MSPPSRSRAGRVVIAEPLLELRSLAPALRPQSVLIPGLIDRKVDFFAMDVASAPGLDGEVLKQFPQALFAHRIRVRGSVQEMPGIKTCRHANFERLVGRALRGRIAQQAPALVAKRGPWLATDAFAFARAAIKRQRPMAIFPVLQAFGTNLEFDLVRGLLLGRVAHLGWPDLSS